MTPDVLTRKDGRAGHISLNKPNTLHALTLDMVQTITASLIAWRTDSAVEIIIIDHAEGRGFCAGGDIAMLRQSALADKGDAGKKFFRAEYQLNYLLFTYPKPVVVFMDGITMGGGVGIALPAKYRVATENTRLAMPESGIGLFPDVGGGWYLSRLAGELGKFLALTGARLDGAECNAVGIATHYVPADTLPHAKTQIAADSSRIEEILGALCVTPATPRILANLDNIDRLFAPETLEGILAALSDDGSAWAFKELATLRAKSPQSCTVALRQLASSAALTDFADNMRMEYRIASRILLRPDFAEGVRALIIDKDNAPKWSPPRPEDISEALLDEIFALLADNEEWKPL